MQRANYILNTRLAPPRQQRRVLVRPALQEALREAMDHRLTVVQAGTGYGKTTALAALGAQVPLLFWYSISEGDADPHQFLSYLIAAFRARLPGMSESPQVILEEREGTSGSDTWLRATDALINALDQSLGGPALLVLDDYHVVAGNTAIDTLMQHLISYGPPDLHVVIASRHPLPWPALVNWRVRGELCEIGNEALAFSPDDIAALFDTIYGMRLQPGEVDALLDTTEGWPIALQLIWQGLRNGAVPSVADLSARQQASLGALFDYLAHDVLSRQPAAIAAFLRETAVLRELTPAACEAVWQHEASTTSTAPATGLAFPRSAADILEHLHQFDLFVVALGERHYRYHHLFHEFLLQQAAADPARVRAGHERAARFFQHSGVLEEAIFHWLAAPDYAAAAEVIGQASEPTLRAGRLDTISTWIDALPPEIVLARPRLQALLGDVCRLHSRFDEALAWYQQAEHAWRALADWAGVSRALRGQANVYLDTVRPADAESLLAEALRLTDQMDDRAAHARLLELLAENKLNMGKPDEARTLRDEARTLRDEAPDEDALTVRVRLRTGRLDEAEQILQSWLAAEERDQARGQVRAHRSHRETVLVLSLIQTMRGEGEQAYELARRGVAIGEQLHSPFVTSVAQARLGHASQLLAGSGTGPDQRRWIDAALRAYETAIAVGDRIAVPRLRVEAQWGMTRAYGFFGDLDAARRVNAEAVERGRRAGDAWIVALIELMLGASHVLAGQPDAALETLLRSLAASRECSDMLGRAAARMWLALAYMALGQQEHMATCLEEALALAEANAYDALWTRPTLLGPPDPRRLVPLLIAARARGIRAAYVARLLAAIGLPDVQHHPGYQLRVQTLGGFRAWRGAAEIEQRDWQRDKARQLVQVLLAARGRPLQRDEICDRLWPDSAPDVAQRDFKVALNALYKALEPARRAESPSAYVARDGSAYRLRPEADLWHDARVFEDGCAAAQRLYDDGQHSAAITQWQSALALYRGDFVPDAVYDDWATGERDRLQQLFLRNADDLAGALLDAGRTDEAIAASRLILERDPCWEPAYRVQMRALVRQGNRPQALRVYSRCVAALRDDLGLEPEPATTALYRQIRG